MSEPNETRLPGTSLLSSQASIVGYINVNTNTETDVLMLWAALEDWSSAHDIKLECVYLDRGEAASPSELKGFVALLRYLVETRIKHIISPNAEYISQDEHLRNRLIKIVAAHGVTVYLLENLSSDH